MKYSNAHELPLVLAVWAAENSYDAIDDDKYISVTSILKPIRQIILTRRMSDTDKMQKDISDFLPVRMGTAIHDSIENSWRYRLKENLSELGYPKTVINSIAINPEPGEEKAHNVYIEQRAIREFNGWKIGGKFDFVMDGMVQDIKSTSVHTFLNKSHDEDYILQGSFYRWLNPEKITLNRMQIHYVFTDWSKLEATRNKDYPQVRAKTVELPLKTEAEVESYLSSKLEEIDKNIDTPEEYLPRCPDEELWFSTPVYKYYKDPTKLTRATRVFESSSEAQEYMYTKGKGEGVVIPYKGLPRRCKYCSAYKICTQRKEYYPEEE